MFNSSSTTKRIKLEAANATIVEGHGEDSDDGTNNKLLSSGSNSNPVTYKLISPAGSGSNTATVLTAPMSGQFYVIGNPSEVANSSAGGSVGAAAGGHGGGRVIAPKATLTLASNSPPPSINVDHGNSSRRIDRRRATHNEVERRRRDTINAWIMQLGKLIPGLDMDDQDKGPPKGGALSKGGILAKACDYVQELNEDNKTLEKRVHELESVADENERLLAAIEELRQDNISLKEQLENHGIVATTSTNMDDILS